MGIISAPAFLGHLEMLYWDHVWSQTGSPKKRRKEKTLNECNQLIRSACINLVKKDKVVIIDKR